MKRAYLPSSRRIRIAFGVLALLAGALVLASVLGLDVFYDDEFLALGRAQADPVPRLADTSNARPPPASASAATDDAARHGTGR